MGYMQGSQTRSKYKYVYVYLSISIYPLLLPRISALISIFVFFVCPFHSLIVICAPMAHHYSFCACACACVCYFLFVSVTHHLPFETKNNGSRRMISSPLMSKYISPRSAVPLRPRFQFMRITTQS